MADVYGAVQWTVDYRLRHRCLEGVRALGVDEIFVGSRKEKFWTLVYQIDEGSRRRLWVGRDRTPKTIEEFFEHFGTKFCEGIAFRSCEKKPPDHSRRGSQCPNARQISHLRSFFADKGVF